MIEYVLLSELVVFNLHNGYNGQFEWRFHIYIHPLWCYLNQRCEQMFNVCVICRCVEMLPSSWMFIQVILSFSQVKNLVKNQTKTNKLSDFASYSPTLVKNEQLCLL